MSSASRNRMDFTYRSSTSIAKMASGSYLYKVKYSQIKEIGVGNFFVSPNFDVGGLKWYIKCYPEGYYTNNNGKYLSLYLSSASETEVNAIFEFCLLDQKGKPSTSFRSKNTHTFRRSGKYKGWSKFVKRDELETYLQDEYFEVICSITILSPNNNYPFLVVPPSNLSEQLGQLLSSKEGSDIIFEVKGEIFHAHKLVLGLRSPVFKAILFGSMKENHAKSIIVNDIEPIIFKALLHFIYTDSLPNEENCDNNDYTIVTQHLLVAADRYALERLKLICQERLCRSMSIETVATTLALAEQHNCSQLKIACLDFFALGENYSRIIANDGYKHLIMSCPSILKEIEEKLELSTFSNESNEQDEYNKHEKKFSLLKMFVCISFAK